MCMRACVHAFPPLFNHLLGLVDIEHDTNVKNWIFFLFLYLTSIGLIYSYVFASLIFRNIQQRFVNREE